MNEATPSVSDARSSVAVSAEELFRQHAPFVARFLARLGVKPDALDDAVQEVFLVVHRGGGYTPGPAKPKSYLATIAVHAAAAARRRERVRAVRIASDDVDALASSMVDPARALEANDGLRCLQRALDRLDDSLRTTLLLADGEGQTCPSIAAAMGVPLGTVYWRLDRARKKFRIALRAVQSEPRRATPPSEAARAPRSSRVGMLMIFGRVSWKDSPERALLQADSTSSASAYDVVRGLSRHRALAEAGAVAPAWLSSASAPATGLLGLGVSIWAVVGATLTSAVLLMGALSSAPPEAASAGLMAVEAVVGDSLLTAMTSPAPPALADAPSAQVMPSTPVEARAHAAVSATPRRRGGSPRTHGHRLVHRSSLAPSGSARDTALGESDEAKARDPLANLPSAQPAEAPSAASAEARDLERAEREAGEAREVGRAERLLARDPEAALALVQALAARSHATYLREERAYIEVVALHKTGKRALAREQASVFLRRYPDSPFARQVAAVQREVEKRR